MSSGQIQLYHKEILDFLRTVTIKFEPFAYLMGQDYMAAHGLTNPRTMEPLLHSHGRRVY